MEGWNVGTIKGESPKHGLICAKDQTIELSEGRESYHRLVIVVVVILALYGSITTRRKYKGTSSRDCSL